MSLLNIIPLKQCGLCGTHIPRGRSGGGKLCDSCKYEKRKILLKLKRLKQKKCHSCGGIILREGVYCSDYCRWIRMLDRRHQKIILRVKDL